MTHPVPTDTAWSRRRWLQVSGTALLLGAAQIARGATILAVRVWPAAEYTRVTIESDTALPTQQTFVDNPPRLAVDIEGIELNPALRDLVGQVRADDPFITGVRVGQFNATTVRLVLDLRQPVKPQVFTLTPVKSGQSVYQHRLVLDLFPVQDLDPMTALIAERLHGKTPVASSGAPAGPAPATAAPPASLGADPLGELMARHAQKPGPTATAPSPSGPLPAVAASRAASSPASAAPEGAAANRTDRFVIVALDPGHGGEDPGAVGPSGTREKTWCCKLPSACASASMPP